MPRGRDAFPETMGSRAHAAGSEYQIESYSQAGSYSSEFRDRDVDGGAHGAGCRGRLAGSRAG